MGFSDARLAAILVLRGRQPAGQQKLRQLRREHGMRPVYKRVDTCAAEFESYTPYLYSTYEDEDEAAPTERKKVMILGSGPNRIGQGIEFDYCCCHASFALRDDGYETIMVNCNPETVSTDYDTSDRLYFEPLTCEDVMAVYRARNLRRRAESACIVQFGGQTPLNLALPLKAAGVPIIGTSPESHRSWPRTASASASCWRSWTFRSRPAPRPPASRRRAGRRQPRRLSRAGAAFVRAGRTRHGHRLRRRRSVEHYMKQAVEYSQERPVLIDHFLEQAIEIDVDCLCDGEDVVIGGIMQHIEEAGIHSGDSSCVLPAVDISEPLLKTIREYTFRLARALKVIGLMNVQYAIQRDKVFVIEVNPRASRTVPYVSKATGVPLAKIAARLMTGRKLREFLPENIERAADLATGNFYYVKSPVFPWSQVSRRRHGARPGDEVHRRSHGRGRQLRRGLRQGADRRRTAAADHGDGVHQRQRPRQAVSR